MTHEEYSLYRRRVNAHAFDLVSMIDPYDKVPRLYDRVVFTKCRSFRGLFEAYKANKKRFFEKATPYPMLEAECTLDEFKQAMKSGAILWCYDSLFILAYV